MSILDIRFNSCFIFEGRMKLGVIGNWYVIFVAILNLFVHNLQESE